MPKRFAVTGSSNNKVSLFSFNVSIFIFSKLRSISKRACIFSIFLLTPLNPNFSRTFVSLLARLDALNHRKAAPMSKIRELRVLCKKFPDYVVA
jgi:hypothetical protein